MTTKTASCKRVWLSDIVRLPFRRVMYVEYPDFTAVNPSFFERYRENEYVTHLYIGKLHILWEKLRPGLVE